MLIDRSRMSEVAGSRRRSRQLRELNERGEQQQRAEPYKRVPHTEKREVRADADDETARSRERRSCGRTCRTSRPLPRPSQTPSPRVGPGPSRSSSKGCRYSGMYVGPRGALGFFSGLVARHASNATRNSGRKRRTASLHRLLVADGVGREPGVEGRRVKGPQLHRLECRAVRVRPGRRGPGQRHSRLRAPFCRRVARPSGHQGDDGEQNRFRDRDVAVPPVVAAALVVGLAVARDLFSNLRRRQSLGHARPLLPH